MCRAFSYLRRKMGKRQVDGRLANCVFRLCSKHSVMRKPFSRKPCIEIERNSSSSSVRSGGAERPISFRQGYLSTDPERIVRVLAGSRGWITVKGLNRELRTQQIRV